MKITNKELLDDIWANQLRIIAKEVLLNYVGGGISVCCDDEFWYISVSSEHRISRQCVTKKITSAHLLNRLKKLKGSDYVTRNSYISGLFFTFMIKNTRSYMAFKEARQFWLDRGVPTGYNKAGTKTNTTKDVDVNKLLPECEKILQEKYGDVNKLLPECEKILQEKYGER